MRNIQKQAGREIGVKVWDKILLIGLVLGAGLVGARTAEDLPVIPKVKSFVSAGAGVWSPKVTLSITAFGADAEKVKKQLVADWRLCGQNFKPGTTAVELATEAVAALGEEGYRLTVTPDKVRISAPTRTGLYWGTRTLLQLSRAHVSIPCGTIEDFPDYPLRGMMLDVGRKYFPMSFLRDVLRELAYYKMNTFHVHLSDDRVADGMQYWAFRMESDVPGLTARDGSYSKDEFRTFVREAAELGVNVIPEFDAPGHSLAFCAVRPDIKLKNGWDQLDVSNPEAIRFVKRVWDEYLDGDDPVFSGPDVHAGTDEYCRGSIEGYRAFTDELFRHLCAKGKRVHAWGSFSSCTGKTAIVSAPDITIDLWHHKSYLPAQALADGYSVTCVPGSWLYIVPGARYYNDYVNERKIIENWSPAVGDGGHPIPASVPRLRGAKFAVWNDQIGSGITTDDVFDRLYPALRVVAEKTWSPTATNWVTYAARAERTGEAPGLDLLDATGQRAYGWTHGGWEVSFSLNASGMAETLFDDGYSKLRIFSCGRLGFSRDGYDVEFNFVPEVGKWHEIRLAGTRTGTTLHVDGKLVNDYQPEGRTYPGGTRWHYSFWRTLHFPCVRAVGCTSAIRNFKVIKK